MKSSFPRSSWRNSLFCITMASRSSSKYCINSGSMSWLVERLRRSFSFIFCSNMLLLNSWVEIIWMCKNKEIWGENKSTSNVYKVQDWLLREPTFFQLYQTDVYKKNQLISIQNCYFWYKMKVPEAVIFVSIDQSAPSFEMISFLFLWQTIFV